MIIKKGILNLYFNDGYDANAKNLTIYEFTDGNFIMYMVNLTDDMSLNTSSTVENQIVTNTSHPQKDYTVYIDKTIQDVVKMYSTLLSGDTMTWITPLTEV